MLASITIETQPPDGSSPTWFVLAQWAGGTVLLVLVILLVVGVVQFVKGKATANSEAARKGLTTAALSLGGAVVIGTSAAAIAWSAQGSNYNILGAGGDGAGSQGIANLMPAGARPAEVEVSRAGPLVSCEARSHRCGTALEHVRLNTSHRSRTPDHGSHARRQRCLGPAQGLYGRGRQHGGQERSSSTLTTWMRSGAGKMRPHLGSVGWNGSPQTQAADARHPTVKQYRRPP